MGYTVIRRILHSRKTTGFSQVQVMVNLLSVQMEAHLSRDFTYRDLTTETLSN
ncbi:hypothetical protein QM012_005485 [Aureobasidium pullulans]|uniref:Uncharacterized protein n=1 Tax=Aureobasidium pullulans TaxID=5580 RepID=A0ABR0T5N6_AURPU